jgi:hypothetical protein
MKLDFSETRNAVRLGNLDRLADAVERMLRSPFGEHAPGSDPCRCRRQRPLPRNRRNAWLIPGRAPTQRRTTTIPESLATFPRCSLNEKQWPA